MIVLLLGCATDPADSLDSADTGDTAGGAPALDDALFVVRGGASASVGRAMDFGPGAGGPGDALWLSGYYVNDLCRFSAGTGEATLASAPLCIHSAVRDSFGFTVAAGRSWVASGAIGGSGNGAYSGTVYLFAADLPDGAHDAAGAPIQLSGELTNDYAGSTVDWLAQADGEVLVVGSPGNDTNGAGSGRIYVFGDGLPVTGSVGAAPTIIQGTSPTPAVKHGDPEAGDGVGQVMASAGDLDGDGDDELAIGCIGADDTGANAGLVAVFTSPLPAGLLALRDADLLLTGEETDQYVGDFVAGLGDATGDGLGDLAISGETLSDEGRTWVFTSPVGSATISAAPTQLVGEAALDQAGASLSGVGDTDGDGLGDLLVGAYGHDTTGVDAGAAYLVPAPFAAGTFTLVEVGLRWLGEAEGDYGGRIVTGGGDFDGDGLADLLVGAPYSDAGGAFGGSAYVLGGE